jgi:hypothetical protein
VRIHSLQTRRQASTSAKSGVKHGRSVLEHLEPRTLFAATVGPADLSVAPGVAVIKTAKSGAESATLKLDIENLGPDVAQGRLQFASELTNGTQSVVVAAKPSAAVIRLKDGQSKVFVLHVALSAALLTGGSLSAGYYDLVVGLDTSKLKSTDSVTTDNTAVFSSNPILVASNSVTGDGTATFTHFKKLTHVAAGGIIAETGTCKWVDGTPANYDYTDEYGSINFYIYPTTESAAELYPDSIEFNHGAPRTFVGKTLTLSTSAKGAIGTMDLPDDGYEPLAAGTYYVHLT